jgi:hypothetical protein
MWSGREIQIPPLELSDFGIVLPTIHSISISLALSPPRSC